MKIEVGAPPFTVSKWFFQGLFLGSRVFSKEFLKKAPSKLTTFLQIFHFCGRARVGGFCSRKVPLESLLFYFSFFVAF